MTAERQTLEDPARHARLRDGGEQSHPSATGRTTKRVDLEHALAQIRSRYATGKRFASTGPQLGRRIGSERCPSPVGRSGRLAIRRPRRQRRFQCLRPCRHHPVPPARTWRENPVIPDLMCPRRRDQRRQPFEQLPPLHHDMCRAVSPGRLQPIGEPSIGQRLEAAQNQQGAGDLAT